MTKPAGSIYRWGVPLLLVAASLSAAVIFLRQERQLGVAGFPIDDAWIHAQFSRHLAAGEGLAFNTGETSTGSTAPLWTLTWALPLMLGADVVVAGKTIGVLAAAVTTLVAYFLTIRITGSLAAGLVSATAVALSPRLVWGALSGMEVPLYVGLVCLALLAFEKAEGARGWLWGGVCGLAVLARPETAVLFPILIIAARGRTRAGVRSAIIGFTLVVAAEIVVNMAISGRPLPSTFYAKTETRGLINAFGRSDLAELLRALTVRSFGALNQVTRYMAEQSLMLFLFTLAGLLGLLGFLRPVAGEPAPSPAGKAVALLLLVAPLAMGALAPVSPLLMQEGRYVSHLLVAFFVASGAGVASIARRSLRPWIVWTVAAVALLRLASQGLAFAPQYALQVDNINRMHVAMGKWLADHSTPDALIATNDIGAIAFFSDRRILDLEGLVTPEIVAFKRDGHVLDYLERARPEMLVIFDEWYPQLAARSDLFSEVHRITVPRVTAAHDTLKAYRTPWTPSDTTPVPPTSGDR